MRPCCIAPFAGAAHSIRSVPESSTSALPDIEIADLVWQPAGADAPTLAVHAWGGDGPPTLLCHPTGFHGRVWAPVAERLIAAGRAVWKLRSGVRSNSPAAPRRERNS